MSLSLLVPDSTRIVSTPSEPYSLGEGTPPTKCNKMDQTVASESAHSVERCTSPRKDELGVPRRAGGIPKWSPLTIYNRAFGTTCIEYPHTTPSTSSAIIEGMCEVVRFSGTREEERRKRSRALFIRDHANNSVESQKCSREKDPPPRRFRSNATRTDRKTTRVPPSRKRKSRALPKLAPKYTPKGKRIISRARRACLRCRQRKVRCTCSQSEKRKADEYWRLKRGGSICAQDEIHIQCTRNAQCIRPNRHPGHCGFPWKRRRIRSKKTRRNEQLEKEYSQFVV